jgi:hypothetical protein
MARIPLQIAERSLDTGGVVNYPQGGGPIGEAVSGFGRALEGVADRYAAMKLREDVFDTQIIEQETENELDRADMEAAANAAPDGTGLHDTMYGQLDPETGAPRKPGAFDNIYDQAAQRVPASQRQRFLEQKEAKRGRRSVRMAGVQLTRRREYETFQLEQKKQDLLNEIMQTDPDDKEAYASIVKRFEGMAISSSKDAHDKEVDIAKMKEDAAIALFEATRKRDPAKAKALIGMSDPGDPGSVRLNFTGSATANAQQYGSGVGEAGVSPRTIGAVKGAFAALGISDVTITSGSRNRTHNSAAGGNPNSRHMEGDAVDIDVSNYSVEERREIIRSLSANGIQGIGVGDNIIHADTGRRRAWGYKGSAGGAPVPAAYKDVIDEHLSGRANAGPVSGPGAISSFVGKVIGVESGGNATAKNPRSTATGAAQFIEGTWLRMMKAHRPDIYNSRSTAEVLAMRNDPTLSREMATALAQENAEYLSNRRVPVTEGTLYLAHFAGADGAVQLLTADPTASVESVLGSAKVNANPFLRGMTAAGAVSWAAGKMGGARSVAPGRYGPEPFRRQEIDPRFEALTFEQRIALANRADASIRDQMALLKGSLETIITNAPVAIQNTGRYDGAMPTQEHFIGAYGAEEGPQRWNAFNTAVETAQQVHSMQTMPNAEMAALIEQARPTSTGDNAALENARYEALTSAASAVAKARADDGAAYVERAFPSVAARWAEARQPNASPLAFQQAVAATVAAQRQLGIAEADILPITKGAAEGAVTAWKNEGSPQDVRAGQAVSLMMATNDPGQRKAIFEQLVEAGMPDMAQGAFLALERGDRGAYNRLLQAAMVDVSKLPGATGKKPGEIDDMIQQEILGDGKVGDVVYGMGVGSDNGERAERDGKLISNAVNLELRRNGGDLKKAVRSVAQDMFGKVQVVTGNRRVNIKALIPEGEDASAFLEAAETMMPAVTKQLEELMAIPDGVAPADGGLAVYSRALPGYGEMVREAGELRQSEDGSGYIFWDPFAQGAIPGLDGKAMIFRPTRVTAADTPTAEERSTTQPSPEPTAVGLGGMPAGAALRDPLAPAPSFAASAPVEQPTLPGDIPAASQSLIDDMEASGRNLGGGAAAGKRDRLTPSGSIPMPGNR